MANEDYEKLLFSDYDDFKSECKKGKAVIDDSIGWRSDPLLKFNLSHPSKIPRPPPTPLPTIASKPLPVPQPEEVCHIEFYPYQGPKWSSETELSEEERYECCVYGELLLDRYNQVKGTDFEFVRLVKLKSIVTAGVNFKIQFEAKPRAAAAEYTLKTFEGVVYKDFVFCHRVWPLCCRLLSPNPDHVYDEEYRCPMPTYEVVSDFAPPCPQLIA